MRTQDQISMESKEGCRHPAMQAKDTAEGAEKVQPARWMWEVPCLPVPAGDKRLMVGLEGQETSSGKENAIPMGGAAFLLVNLSFKESC